MKKIYITLFLITVLIFSILCACADEPGDSSTNYITLAIDKINNSNSISVHFKSESTMESDHIAHGILDSDIIYVKKPYIRYSEQINSYFENNEKKFDINYGSYITTVNGKLKHYEKSGDTADKSLEWKPSVVEDESLKDLANFYSKELDAYLNMFSVNKNNFQKEKEENIEQKSVIKYKGYFTKETATESITKYLKESFLIFGTDFTEAYPLTKISKSPDNTPVSIWFEKESGTPIKIHIDMTEADQYYLDTVSENLSSPNASHLYKVNDSYITIKINLINNKNTIPLPKGLF